MELRTSPGAVDRVVWDTIVDNLPLRPDFDGGKDGAVAVADEVRSLCELGRRRQVERRRRQSLRTAVTALVAVASVVAVLAGIASFVWWRVDLRSNDYAHTDPGSVEAGAYYGIRQWFGENDLPRVALRSAVHSSVDGHRAWLTRWASPGGRAVCVYVWGRANQGTPHGTYAKVAPCP